MDLKQPLIFALTFALAAGVGAFCRYALSNGIEKICGRSLQPWGLFTVNILGCFGFGLIMGLEQSAKMNIFTLSEDLKTLILTGFLGSFTTFSTFIFEADLFLKNKKYSQLALHIIGQIGIGFLAFYLGIYIFSLF